MVSTGAADSVNSFENEILRYFGDSIYPDVFLDQYEFIECFACHDGCETFKVKNKETGELAVSKWFYDKSIFSCDDDLLKSLNYAGLPAYIDSYENEDGICFLWEYVEGISLDRFMNHHLLSEQQAIAIAISLCDILENLHLHEPPLIHRDIKPQNIIIQEDGTIKLIDFGIARAYDANATKDTVMMGAQDFSPPEQGFSQTDGRSDLYSLGITVFYLVTGKTDRKLALKKMTNHRLAKVLGRCTEFSPDKRYATAEQLKNSLLLTDGKRQQTLLCIATAVLACMVCLYTGFAIGRYTSFAPGFLQESSVVFMEPLIEQAVRLQLGKELGEKLSADELQSVEMLYIFCDQTAKTRQDYHATIKRLADNGAMKNGGIRSLEDLKHLPNLRELAVSMQQITDLYPLRTLTRLEVVDIKNNPVSDLSALSDLTFLMDLSIFDTLVKDFSPLKSCVMLRTLDAGKTAVQGPEMLNGLSSLENLYLERCTLQSIVGIEQFTKLKELKLTHLTDKNLEPLLSLPVLQRVNITEDLRDAAKQIEAGARFKIEYNE